jgi:MFS family permease
LFLLCAGITFATFWSGAVRYTNRIAQPELLASAQGLLAGLYSGLGNGTGAILGGELEKVFGMRIMFAIGAGWMVVIGIFFAVATKYMGPPPIQSPGPVEEAKSTEPASEALSSSTVPTAAFSHAAQHDEVELSVRFALLLFPRGCH